MWERRIGIGEYFLNAFLGEKNLKKRFFSSWFSLRMQGIQGEGEQAGKVEGDGSGFDDLEKFLFTNLSSNARFVIKVESSGTSLCLSLTFIRSLSHFLSHTLSLSFSIIHTHTFTRSSLPMIPHLIPSQSLPFLFYFVFLFLPQTLHRFWILFQWTCVWPSWTNTSELPPNRETSYEWRERRERMRKRESKKHPQYIHTHF